MELKIEYLNKEDLRPYANNAKIHTPEQVDQIKNSIRKFGFNDQIAVWGDNEIVEGHGRLMAAMEMDEIKTLPVIRLDNLTDKQRKAYTIAHNKLTNNTGFDSDILGIELKDIINEIDMTELGFSDFEITILTEDFTPDPYDDNEVEKYTQNSDNYLAKKRVIITYADEDEQKLANLLNIDAVLKVVYDISELVRYCCSEVRVTNGQSAKL